MPCLEPVVITIAGFSWCSMLCPSQCDRAYKSRSVELWSLIGDYWRVRRQTVMVGLMEREYASISVNYRMVTSVKVKVKVNVKKLEEEGRRK